MTSQLNSPEDEKTVGKRREEEKRAELFGSGGGTKKKGLMQKMGFGKKS